VRFTVLLALFLTLPCAAQTFEAASLRPLLPGAKPDTTGVEAFMPENPGTWKAPPLISSDLNLFDLVVTAYAISNGGTHDAIMAQLPPWGMTQRFHLTARTPEGATLQDLRLMMQTFLHERFALTAHWENRTIPVLLLQQVSERTRLQAFTGTCEPQLANCTYQTRFADRMVHVTFTGLTLPQMADELSGFAHYMGGQKRGPVLDDTHLPGQWNATLDFAPLFGTNDAEGESFTSALKKQMGLTLKPGERPVPSLIIDHVDRPTTD
jgi:uncharacterized protein (TIGR03435 family)